MWALRKLQYEYGVNPDGKEFKQADYSDIT